MVNIWLISSLGVRYQTEGEFGGCVQVNWDIHVCTCEYLQLHLPLVYLVFGRRNGEE